MATTNGGMTLGAWDGGLLCVGVAEAAGLAVCGEQEQPGGDRLRVGGGA